MGAARDAAGCVTAGWHHPNVLCFPVSSHPTAAFCTGVRPHLLARAWDTAWDTSTTSHPSPACLVPRSLLLERKDNLRKFPVPQMFRAKYHQCCCATGLQGCQLVLQCFWGDSRAAGGAAGCSPRRAVPGGVLTPSLRPGGAEPRSIQAGGPGHPHPPAMLGAAWGLSRRAAAAGRCPGLQAGCRQAAQPAVST